MFSHFNRRRDRVKILYWDRDGFAVSAKPWKKARMRCRSPKARARQEIVGSTELGALLSGIDLSQQKHRKQYHQKSRINVDGGWGFAGEIAVLAVESVQGAGRSPDTSTRSRTLHKSL